VRKLLVIDPWSRLAMKDALSHKWLRNHIVSPLRSRDIIPDKDIISSFTEESIHLDGSFTFSPIKTAQLGKLSMKSAKIRASRKLESLKKSRKRRIRKLESSQMDFKKSLKKENTCNQERLAFDSPSNGLRNLVAFFSEAFLPRASFW